MNNEYSQIRLIENPNHIEAELVATDNNNTTKNKQPPNLTVIICSNHQVVNAPSVNISGDSTQEIVKSLEKLTPEAISELFIAISHMIEKHDLEK
jgi:hypothetical protein